MRKFFLMITTAIFMLACNVAMAMTDDHKIAAHLYNTDTQHAILFTVMHSPASTSSSTVDNDEILKTTSFEIPPAGVSELSLPLGAQFQVKVVGDDKKLTCTLLKTPPTCKTTVSLIVLTKDNQVQTVEETFFNSSFAACGIKNPRMLDGCHPTS